LNYDQIRRRGDDHLNDIKQDSGEIGVFKARLSQYQFKTDSGTDPFSWLTCILALKAVYKGNLGIGCVLVDENSQVVTEGHNQVFKPYFRSDRHAEMVVMDEFEDTHKDVTCLNGYTLYTSLESCPMCFTRLIISGINTVYHIAPDECGGMVHQMKTMPKVWIGLAEGKTFKQAACSEELVDISNSIFTLNRKKLDEIIKQRQG
jgi:tRNA(Arg) A34 adenosine deaminase TadA